MLRRQTHQSVEVNGLIIYYVKTLTAQGSKKRCAARPTRCLRAPHVELTPDNVLGTIVLMAIVPRLVLLPKPPVKDPDCKGIEPRPLRAVAGASIAPPPNLRETNEIVPGEPQFNHSNLGPACIA